MAYPKPKSESIYNKDCPVSNRFDFTSLKDIADFKYIADLKESLNKELLAQELKKIKLESNRLLFKPNPNNAQPDIKNNELSPETLAALMKTCSNKKTKNFILYLMVQREIDQEKDEIDNIIDNIICSAPKLAVNILSENKLKIRALLEAIQTLTLTDESDKNILALYNNLLGCTGNATFISGKFNLCIALDKEYTKNTVFFKLWKYIFNGEHEHFTPLTLDIFKVDKLQYDLRNADNADEAGKTKKIYTADISCISRHVNRMYKTKMESLQNPTTNLYKLS